MSVEKAEKYPYLPTCYELQERQTLCNRFPYLEFIPAQESPEFCNALKKLFQAYNMSQTLKKLKDLLPSSFAKYN